MTNKPRVSIIMSVYNGERYLPTAVQGVLAQEFDDFEFIIVNDGSDDGTLDLLARYAAADGRIRVVDQPNTGLTVALRNGCAVARGEFIARQDADDWSHPSRLKQCVGLLDRVPDVVMASSWTMTIDEAGDLVEANTPPADRALATRQLLEECIGPPGHGSMMFRRAAYEAVGGYRSCFYFAQDIDLWLRLGGRGTIAYVPDYLYQYRISPRGISGWRSKLQWQFGFLAQDAHAARRQGRSEEPFLDRAERLRAEVLGSGRRNTGSRRLEAAANYRIGVGLSRHGNPRARSYFWSAIRLDPIHWRSWCRLGVEWARGRFAPGRSSLPLSAGEKGDFEDRQ
jgi:glycosyltransferase involved in cell wall biosynthesis